MEVVLEIPDNIAKQLQTNGLTLQQRALEDLAVEAYRREELSLGQFAEMLNLSINDANGLLKERGIFDDLSLEEFEEQRHAIEGIRQGLESKRRGEGKTLEEFDKEMQGTYTLLA